MNDVVIWVVGAAAFVGAVYTLHVRVVKPLVKAGKVVHKTYDKVMDYDDRIRVTEERTAQLVNNGGSSLRDAIDRIEANQQADRDQMKLHLEWSQTEVLKLWQAMATRDAALKVVRNG